MGMSRRTTVEPSVRYRVALVPGWIASLAVVAPFLAGVSIPPALQYAPLVVSAVLLGLPHGAVDHLAVARTRGKRPDWRAIARVFALYGVVGGTYAVAWFLAPAAAFVLFIAVTWFHWGQGDLYALRALADADHLRTLPQRIGTVLVRGGLPMLVPLLAFPEWYRRVATDLVSLFAPDAVAAIGWAFRTDVRTALALAYGALVVATLAVGFARADARRPWLLDAGETLGLLAYFALVPPVLAIGVYFCLWHSLRHVARLLLVDDDATAALQNRDPSAALARFARDAAPLTAVSLALLGGLYFLVPNPPGSVPEWVALYLVFIAVVTLPHVVVVSIMDREQGVWA
ncbi:beta-carotene 15,15'-monooxygenase [Haloarcula hispanica]|uniref:Probable beta-carotene 15,15'-dioxygenase n=2 Tax=Haloarcula hispanica TaxID=51589 RepID=A0A5J5LMK3_HALHI|nr:beta-carotene 15,15'-monooxygenase [Haloarcula hispanica]